MKDKENPSQEKKGRASSRRREIVSVLLLALSLFSLISLYVPSSGVLGRYIKLGLERAFGHTAPFYGFVLFYLALLVFRGRLTPFPYKRAFGLLVAVASLTAAIHYVLVYKPYDLPPSLQEEIGYALRGAGGGVLGALLMVGVLTAFGIPGSYVFLGAFFLIGCMLLFDRALSQVLNLTFGGIAKALQRTRDNIGEGLQKRRVRIQDARERKKYKKREEKRKKAPPAPVLEKEVPQKPKALKPKKEKEEKPQEKEERLTEKPLMVGPFQLPPLYLLKKGTVKVKLEGLDKKQQALEDTLASFGISARVVNSIEGPTVTRYELQPAPGVKVSKITNLADDIALSLAAADVRIEAPVPGKSVIGIEVPNNETTPVFMRDCLEHPDFHDHPSKVALVIGKDIAGQPVVADLKKWLHLLIAGSTGSGKSVCLNAILASILYKATPDEVQLLMIDPKRVELAIYDGIPHLISPVVTDPKKAAIALRWAVAEMERRYKLFAELGVRNVDMYSQLPPNEEIPREHLPYIVVIVDELADLMMVAAAEVEDAICRLAQMARAAGMYLIIATQRPSVDVITGLIKANVPSRIAFAVSSQIDSRTILDMGGAERLVGKGDMLYYPIGSSKPTRAQGAWIADSEVEEVVAFWKNQGTPAYQNQVLEEKFTEKEEPMVEGDDELLADAITLVVDSKQASISMLQRRFRIGYSRAARLIDMMEVRGIVGSYQGSKPREVLIGKEMLEDGVD